MGGGFSALQLGKERIGLRGEAGKLQKAEEAEVEEEDDDDEDLDALFS